MKIGQFSTKTLSATWFVWNVSTFKALHPRTLNNEKGFCEFGDITGKLRFNDVKLVVECHITDRNGTYIGRGFTGCSKEDKVELPFGMKLALERAFTDLALTVAISKTEIADFYANLFKEGTFGWRLRFHHDNFTHESFHDEVVCKFNDLTYHFDTRSDTDTKDLDEEVLEEDNVDTYNSVDVPCGDPDCCPVN